MGLELVLCAAATHHKFTWEHLLVITDKLVEGLKELDHTVILLECRILLKCLLDQLAQLPGLDHKQGCVTLS